MPSLQPCVNAHENTSEADDGRGLLCYLRDASFLESGTHDGLTHDRKPSHARARFMLLRLSSTTQRAKRAEKSFLLLLEQPGRSIVSGLPYLHFYNMALRVVLSIFGLLASLPCEVLGSPFHRANSNEKRSEVLAINKNFPDPSIEQVSR